MNFKAQALILHEQAYLVYIIASYTQITQKGIRLNMKEYVGVIHVHSKYSDGSGSINEIMDTANSVGLDYLILTDHMNLKAKEAGFEGYHKNTLLLVGYEHNDLNQKNHYLIFGCKNKAFPYEYTPQEYITAAKKAGCLGFIAHPAEKRKAIKRLPPYPWQAWDAKGFDGIEIWNQLSDWAENITIYNVFYRILFPRRFLNPPAKEILSRWDKMNQTQKISAIGGTDTHAYKYGIGFFRFTFNSYKVSFKSIRTHILLEKELSKDLNKDKQQMLNALKNGNSFISNLRAGDAKGFNMWVESDKEKISIGNEAKWQENMKLYVTMPLEGNIDIIKNGEKIFSTSSKACELPIDTPGVYRIEVARNKKPWIYSNPIYIRQQNEN